MIQYFPLGVNQVASGNPPLKKGGEGGLKRRAGIKTPLTPRFSKGEGGQILLWIIWAKNTNLKTAVATPLMLRYTLLRKALSTNGVVSNWMDGRSP